MKIAYIKDDLIVAETFTQEIEINFPHVIIDREISEPIESWYIEDGQIKIDQQKLIEFNRKNMPTLSPIEFDIKLVDVGLYDAVQELIKDNFELRIAYTRAIFFSRLDPFIDQARISLGLTNEQVDEIWTS
ncbi:hypothetical protein P3S51_04105 [Acinetobacter sp. ANC 7201]|uniref:hypothetical protein n=1 Tax=Acinetobacter sp. ANC 7201 TaxID=3035288 RepID=UPI0027A89376|nr:hypothetical protein [Acinetobacter sp. ANC 7201]WFP97527.1 hypothetical protein P3S51_04105 [Acinetobacter sp. ANC 7201]